MCIRDRFAVDAFVAGHHLKQLGHFLFPFLLGLVGEKQVFVPGHGLTGKKMCIRDR